MCITVNGEAQSEDHNVRHRGDDAQHHSVQQLEWQHGVHGEDDEEKERHLENNFSFITRPHSANLFVDSQTISK